jgi:hypothetical protein
MKSYSDFIQIVRLWGGKYWVMLVVFVFVLSVILIKRNQERISIVNAYDRESFNKDILVYREKIASLSYLNEVPSLHVSWVKSKIIVNKYKLIVNNNYHVNDIYNGPLLNWSGNISGPTIVLLSAMKELQKTVPVYFYGIRINGDHSEVDFSIVGGEDE